MANIISGIKVPNIGTSAIRSAYVCYGITTGSGQAYSVSVRDHTGAAIALDSYQDGLTVVMKIHTDQTVANPTLNVNGLGAVTMMAKDGGSLSGLNGGTYHSATYVTVSTNTHSFVVTTSETRELPAATSSDSGKFLTVGTTGEYTLETVPSAENTLY